MPHIITGEIRKAPYTKTGTNNNGEWKMYAVELSESFKPRDGDRQYTNYRVTLFASNEKVMKWYDSALAEGKVISVTCESLSVNQRESNGKNYITLEMNNPSLSFTQRDTQEQVSGGSNARPQNYPPVGGQRGQQSRPAAHNNPPPADYDDSIPF